MITTSIKMDVMSCNVRGAALALLWLASQDACCDPLATGPRSADIAPRTSVAPASTFDWSPAPESLGFSALPGDASAAALMILPRGNEMASLAGVELERTDRRFRARVVEWFNDRSVVAGLASDFVLHGSDTGLHLHMQPGAEYLVRWERRF